VLSSSATPEVLSIQNLITVKKRSGLSAEKRVKRVPAGRASPKRGARTKRKIKHGKERNLLVDESANVGQQG
jgi:hypothetical protein